MKKFQGGVNTMFRKGKNTLLKVSKGMERGADAVEKAGYVAQKVGEATGISELEGAGRSLKMSSDQIGKGLDRGNNRLEKIIKKTERTQDKFNTKYDDAKSKYDDGLQRVKNVKQIIKTDGAEVLNDGKKVFGV